MRPRDMGLRIADLLRGRIAASLSDKFKENPEAFAKLVELGIVDPDILGRGEQIDLATTIRQFRDRIAEIAQAEPSVLASLDVRPLEIMASDKRDSPTGVGRALVPLTVVFSDLEGFTPFTSRRGDLEASALLTDHYDAVSSIVANRGGSVIKKIGDGHMLCFREPAAAVMATLDLVSLRPGPLRVRAGAHNGQVVKMDDDLLGHVVNVASRVTDLASGGMSIVTASVRDAAGRLPRVEFKNERVEELHGLDEMLAVCEVAAA